MKQINYKEEQFKKQMIMNSKIIQKITPTLWFDGKAEEAMNFYVSVFPNSKINFVKRWPEDISLPDEAIKPGTIQTASFTLDWMQFYAFDAGSAFQFNPSISFYATFETIAEVNEVWSKLAEGGEVLMPLERYDWSELYGWIKDRYGVSWNIAKDELRVVGQPITPLIMFSGNQRGEAEDAIDTYMWIFDDSVIHGIARYGEGDQGPYGMIKHGQCRLMGQTFMMMDNGTDSDIPFNEAISFYVNCHDQKEVDYYWNKFTKEGSESQCGWLKDKFGVSWQIVPEFVMEKVENGEPNRINNMNEAMYQMKKLDVAQLMEAYNKDVE